MVRIFADTKGTGDFVIQTTAIDVDTFITELSEALDAAVTKANHWGRGLDTQGAAMNTEKITKYLSDAIPKGEHPAPHSEWISVRLDVVEAAIDRLEWLEAGISEWQAEFTKQHNYAKAARATNRVAIRHLQAVLNESRSHSEQQKADTAARDWLLSIGSEPGAKE